MNPLAIYRRLPYPLKVAAASLRGYQLERWRYGPETERLVDETLDRERWSAEEWTRWRDARLAGVLDRAARVPGYRPAPAAPSNLDSWPLLEKATLRENPRAFLVPGTDPRSLYREQTSGSTGTPLQLFWGLDTVRAWYALVEARLRRWHGVDRRDRWAILGGQLVADVRRTRPPFWVWNAAMRQLYLSAYHLAPDFAPAQVDALRRHRVRYLLGYPSALHALAAAILDRGLPADDLDLRVVLTNAEPLYPHQRRAIGEAFGCPVRETYGMAELVAAASECERGRLHLWPEVGLVETGADTGLEAEGLGRGLGRRELVATGLLNLHQPLVRYRVGDRIVLADPSYRCPCGRTLPVVERIEGRVDDVLLTPDGRRVGRLDPVFKADLPIVEAQIVQERLDLVRLRVVPATGFDDATADDLRRRLAERLGDAVSIEVERVDRLERGAGGKLRAVIGLR